MHSKCSQFIIRLKVRLREANKALTIYVYKHFLYKNSVKKSIDAVTAYM